MSRRIHLTIDVLRSAMLAAAILTTLLAKEAISASKGAVSGTVSDAATGDPLPNVTLMVPQLRRGTITNSDGEFLIKNVPPGTYTVRARRVGYIPSQDTLTMTGGEKTILNIRLLAEPIPMEPVQVKAPRTVRQRVDNASEDAEAYAYREGRSRAPISREEGEWLALTARAIREGQYELARSYAAEVGYEVEQYREPDVDREYVVLQEKEERVKGWGTFIYHPDYRFVDVIVQRIVPDFTGPAVQDIASSIFEDLGARALLICGAETSGWGSDTSPFKCILDEWSDERTLLVQIVGVAPRRDVPEESNKTRTVITDNRLHPPEEEAPLFPDLVWEGLRLFRRRGFGVIYPGAPSIVTEDRMAQPGAGFAGMYARRVGREEQVSYSASMYTVDVPSFGVVIGGVALKKTAEGMLQARIIRDTLTEFLIQKVLSGLRMDQIAEASGLFRKSQVKLSASETPNLVKMLLDRRLEYPVRQAIMEGLLSAGPASVDPLVEALIEARDEPYVRENAMGILAGIGTPSVNALIGVLKHKDDDVRRRAAWALRRIGDERAAFPLMALLKDRDREVRKEAILGLGTARSTDAVPVLLEHIPRADVEARRAIVWSLGEIGDPRAIEPLRALLRDPDGALRRAAAESLSRIVERNPGYIDVLMDGTQSPDPLVRVESAAALGRSQDEATIDPLLSLTRDDHAEVRYAAAKALGNLGDSRATPALVDLLDDDREKVRMSAALALGDLRAIDSVPELVGRLSDPDGQVRMVTARALGEVGDTRAVSALIEALDDPDRKVRIEAIFALGKLQDPRGTEPLIALLVQEESRISREAVAALQEILREHPGNVDILVQLLDAADVSLRKRAMDALEGITDPKIVEPLMQALQDKDPAMRRRATERLAETRDTRAVDPLLARLYDRSPIVRVEIMRTLGEMGDVRAVDPLLGVLRRTVRSFELEQNERDELLRREAVAALEKIIDVNSGDVEMLTSALGARDPAVRRKAISSLRRSYRPEAVDALIDALQDDDWYVRREAALTLPRFRDMRAAPPLLGLLKDDKVQVRRAAAWALGELPDGEAVEDLIGALQDEDWGVRKEAAVSLGKLGNPSARKSLDRMRDDPRREVREAVEWALNQLSTNGNAVVSETE